MVVDVCRSTGAAAGSAQGRWAQKGGPKDSATRGVGYRLDYQEPVDAGEAPQPGDHDVRAGADVIRVRLDAEVITEL